MAFDGDLESCLNFVEKVQGNLDSRFMIYISYVYMG